MAIRTARSTAAPVAAAPAEAPSRLRAEVWWFLELFVLCGFVVAQPLFDVAGRSPDFFLFRRAGAADILLLVTLAVVGPPLVLWAGAALAGTAGPGARRLAQLAVVGGLLALLALQVAKRLTPVRGAPLLALAVAGGVGATLAYRRSRAARMWLRFAVPAPLVFALLFVTVSPVGGMVVPGGGRAGRVPVAVPAATRVPVVLVVFDELPMQSLLDARGRIDRRIFPNFARFAGDATWYRNATGLSPFTPDAVPAMLTGRYPTRFQVAPTSTEYPDNLFSLLAGAYDVRAFETVTQLCPPTVCTAAVDAGRTGWRALGRDLAAVWARIVSPRRADDDPLAQFTEATAGDRERAAGAAEERPGPTFRFDQLRANQPARFADFLGQLQASDRPALQFLHLLLPHQPFRYFPSGARYSYPPIPFGHDRVKGWTTEAAPVQLGLQRHLLQLAYTDRLVGQVIRKLQAEGLYDEALVIMTADHGNSFTPGQVQRVFQERNAHELMWVPLFVKAPQQRQARVDDRNWEHVDLLPTIADVLGIEVPWKVDGVSGLAAPRSRRAKYFFDKQGRRFEVDGPDHQALALRGVTDRVARPQHGPDGLYQVGPFADLVGRRVEAVGVGARSGLSARLDRPETLRDVNPDGIVPALVSGALAGRVPDAPVTLAVALNGTIGAVGRTFTQEDTPQTFAAVVPDRLFQPGTNTVGLYLVERTRAGPRLRPVALTT